MAAEVLQENLPVKFWLIEEGWEPGDKAACQILQAIEARGQKISWVKRGLLKNAVDTKTPQGIAAVFRPPQWNEGQLSEKAGPLVLLDQIQDPGNLGTIARASEGAGVAGILLAKGSADPGNSKALRASAGSLLRMPALVVENPIRTAKEAGLKIIATAGDAEKSYSDADLTEPFALLLGQEGSGLKKSTVDAADLVVKIPTQGRLESLNVATAASVILFEAARQRRKKLSGPESVFEGA